VTTIFRQIAGGLVIIAIASIVAIAHNAMRSRPLKLIQKIEAVSTVQHGEPHESAAIANGDSAGTSEALPEGAIAVAEVKRLVDENLAVVIDARVPDAFDAGHIPGAVNIPYDQLPDYISALELAAAPDEMVICYCWGPSCDFSDQLATELKIMGYENIKVFTGGWEHWQEAGHPTEGADGE
jgi:rhodanese-related sulfurtransferase